jgi:hypothetical protein
MGSSLLNDYGILIVPLILCVGVYIRPKMYQIGYYLIILGLVFFYFNIDWIEDRKEYMRGGMLSLILGLGLLFLEHRRVHLFRVSFVFITIGLVLISYSVTKDDYNNVHTQLTYVSAFLLSISIYKFMFTNSYIFFGLFMGLFSFLVLKNNLIQ